MKTFFKTNLTKNFQNWQKEKVKVAKMILNLSENNLSDKYIIATDLKEVVCTQYSAFLQEPVVPL